MAMTIGELARRAGVAASAIRYYEAEGLLPAPMRRGGRRIYDRKTADRLAIIRLARQTGFTIADLRTLMGELDSGEPASRRWQRLAGTKIPEIERRIAADRAMLALLRQGLDCDCLRLEDCALLL